MADESERTESRGLSAGRITLLVVGALLALVGLALTAGGGVLVWAHATQRDSSGFYTTSTEPYATSTYALTSQVDLGDVPGEHGWTITHPVGTVRVTATSADAQALFVGIAPQADVESWLAGVEQERVHRANFGPFHTETTVVAGTRVPSQPLDQSFWVASVSGPGTQTLLWPSEGGKWTAVIMNADASPGVRVDVSLGAKTGVLLPLGLGVGSFGLLLVVGASLMFFFALRHQVTREPEAVAPFEPVPGTYPARLNGHLDPGVSRWMWLLKWLLVIPHVVVLAFLWLAVTVLTVIAGFAILFTGRYPRSIFDFNVGVMRWTWRVSFYGLSAFATDRYPPFTLRRDPDFPADFAVDYPDHLSRGLVLVKWWLLALPHYLIVAVFAGGWGWPAWNGAWRTVGSGGLIAILALVAVVTLAARGRYPEPIFEFVMGLNRWCFRVLAYSALLRDEYPPFRLDTGGLDPGSTPAPPPPPAPPVPGQSGDLVGAHG